MVSARCQVLEEDSVQLSTIKASKFYNSFADKIDKWEKALNAVSETVDLILTVQKKWMYLESIFMASEDICKQLPRESAIFTEVRNVVRVQLTGWHVHMRCCFCFAILLCAAMPQRLNTRYILCV